MTYHLACREPGQISECNAIRPGSDVDGGRPMEQTPESRALQDLDRAWGHLYDLAYRDGRYLARRADGTGQALTADTPEELDAAIRADQAAR